MVRNLLIAVAAIGAFASISAGTANADMCDKHGTGPGHMYIHACAKGGGGGGSTMMVKNPATGQWKKVNQQDAVLRPGHLFDN